MTAHHRPDTFRDFVLDQLAGVGEVTARAMFGGHGLYVDGLFFAIIHRGALYLHATGPFRDRYERCGMGPFRPNPRQTLGTYLEVPAHVLEDADTLCAWAEDALASSASHKR